MIPIDQLKIKSESDLKQAMERIEKEIDTFKSADQMTEDQLLDECFLDECEKEKSLSED